MASNHQADVPALAEALARMLVEHPDEVEVDVVEESERSLELELYVAEEDMGHVIGRSGRTARCLRNILSAAASKLDKRCSLDIVE